MKFRIFGGLDCPDSVLAQLSVVSTLSMDQLGRLVDHCIACITQLHQHDDNELQQMTISFSKTFGSDPMSFAQAATAVHTVVSSIVRCHVSCEHAVADLTMLGLDQSAAEVIANGVHSSLALLDECLQRQTPLLNQLSNIRSSVVTTTPCAWNQEALRYDPVEDAEEQNVVRLTMTVGSEAPQVVQLEMGPEKAKALLAELVMARNVLLAQNRLR